MNDNFKLESLVVKDDRRGRYMAIIREAAGDAKAAKASHSEIRRLLRRVIPLEIKPNTYNHRVWLQCVRRFLGLPTGSLRRRTMRKSEVITSARDWAKRQGLILTDEMEAAAPGGVRPPPMRKQAGLPPEGDGGSPRPAKDEPSGEGVAGGPEDLRLQVPGPGLRVLAPDQPQAEGGKP